MKNYLLFVLVFFVLFSGRTQDAEPRIFSQSEGYNPTSISYLFGDNVKLRSQPNSDAEVLALLKIGTEIEILEKILEKLKFNGLESFWYKVKVDERIGYLLQGLISFEKLSFGKTDYYFGLRQDEDNIYLKIRYLTSDSTFTERESILENDAFTLDITSNKGYEEIDHIVHVKYFSEACMVEGGGQYYFSDGKVLTKALDYSSISDGGIFWFSEQLIFPEDEMGSTGKLIYQRNLGNFIEEENEESSWWTEEQIVRREFIWKNNSFHPNLEEFRLKLNEDE